MVLPRIKLFRLLSLFILNIGKNMRNCSIMFPELHGLDSLVTQGQCNYGGHMVRIINEDLLRKCMEEEAHDEVSILKN